LQVPHSFQDFLSSIIAKPSHIAEILSHSRRELVHQVWRLLLDDEFIEAYRHGIVLKCSDGIIRRIYPRIFTYSADYPEK
jgi:Plavaka transposase